MELSAAARPRSSSRTRTTCSPAASRSRFSRPGKALKTITLLSGGEKAFVAIALYFAILKVHPTPFCVMDEIEAALDEPNVVRVANYMRRITSKTQFIVTRTAAARWRQRTFFTASRCRSAA